MQLFKLGVVASTIMAGLVSSAVLPAYNKPHGEIEARSHIEIVLHDGDEPYQSIKSKSYNIITIISFGQTTLNLTL
jgi:hypothetical protein